MFSIEFVEFDDPKQNEPSKFERFIEKHFEGKSQDILIYFSLIVALGFNIGLFILLPNFIASLLHLNKHTSSGLIYYNLVEAVTRTLIFLGYIISTSRIKDIQRVYQYHGAEHKTIHCYEHGEELIVENVKKYPTKHPRCGTSFLFLVMIVSIFVFSFLGWYSVIINLLVRLALLPLVAGLSYEIMKLVGRCEWKIMKFINAPGFFLQLFTTREPDEKQIEVAISAFNGVLVPDTNADKW